MGHAGVDTPCQPYTGSPQALNRKVFGPPATIRWHDAEVPRHSLTERFRIRRARSINIEPRSRSFRFRGNRLSLKDPLQSFFLAPTGNASLLEA